MSDIVELAKSAFKPTVQDNDEATELIDEAFDVFEYQSFGQDLSMVQIQLIQDLAVNFSLKESISDTSILYEVTGLKCEHEDSHWWSNYEEYEVLDD